ncbi:hypothetical protein FACS1894208_04340 [Clostridia bacterium]|nr:hypothetical protein FACS1894208_04340 [Clostridia bacterium]
MFRPEIISQLKKVNISRDEGKTKARLNEVYRKSKNVMKNEIDKLSGLKRTAVYRAMNTGVASARVIIPVAQILDVSPYWLIGATDDRGRFKLEKCTELLKELGYSKLAASLEGSIVVPAKLEKAPKPAEQPTAPVTPVTPAPKPVEVAQSPAPEQEIDSAELEALAAKLTFAEAVTLLEALYIRGAAGGKAGELLTGIKKDLLK